MSTWSLCKTQSYLIRHNNYSAKYLLLLVIASPWRLRMLHGIQPHADGTINRLGDMLKELKGSADKMHRRWDPFRAALQGLKPCLDLLEEGVQTPAPDCRDEDPARFSVRCLV